MADALTTAVSCRITTSGRATGRPHTVTVWFALTGTTVYVLSRRGAEGDWVRNVEADPEVAVRTARVGRLGIARIVEDPAENLLARQLMHAKYSSRHRVDSWLQGEATVVAIDLQD